MADEKFSNFLTEIIDADLAEGKVKAVSYTHLTLPTT